MDDLYDQCDPERENLCLYGVRSFFESTCMCLNRIGIWPATTQARPAVRDVPPSFSTAIVPISASCSTSTTQQSAFVASAPAALSHNQHSASTGESDGSWAVDLPAEEVPAELPEPCLGINFARSGMQQRDWLALVAVHSDAWLLSVAFYYGASVSPSSAASALPLLSLLRGRGCGYQTTV